MEANELMIGDWVMPKGSSHAIEVKGITPRGAVSYQYADGSMHTKDAWYFEPVLLSNEILNNNPFFMPFSGCPKCEPQWGWGSEESHIKIALQCPGRGHFAYHRKDDNKRLQFSGFHNLHELQHLLRLVGLHTIADSFQCPERQVQR